MSTQVLLCIVAGAKRTSQPCCCQRSQLRFLGRADIGRVLSQHVLEDMQHLLKIGHLIDFAMSAFRRVGPKP